MTDAASNSKLNLVIVIEQFNPHAGGAERSTAEIAAELARRGHRVTVLAGACVDIDVLPGVTVKRFAIEPSSTVLRLLLFSRWARRELTEGDYDASLSITMAVPATVVQPRGGTVRETLNRNVALRPKAHKRAWKRVMLALNPKQQTLLALERRTLADPAVRKFAAVSGYVVDQLRNHYDIPPERIELIHNAAAMPKADDAQKQAWRQAVRQGFNVPDDATLYLFAAQNPRLKGYGTLLEAVRQLVREKHKPVVLLAGSFWYPDHAAAVAKGVRGQVRFVRQTRKMAALYAAADVTVLPTYYDPASKVVIESLMMGTPAISTAFNGASDFILPPGGPVRGRVIADPGDAEALACAMSELADPAERHRCRDACAGLGDSLSMVRHVDRLEAVLIQAAAEAAAGGAADGAIPADQAENPLEQPS